MSTGILATHLGTYLIELYKSSVKKGRIHFFPDAFNNGWSKQHDTEMNLRVSGTFTYSDGAERVLIMEMFLKGTKSIGGMQPQILLPDSSAKCIADWWLQEDSPVRALTDLRLTPVIGKSKEPLRAKLILKDNLHRQFIVGEVEFPYIGR